MRIPPLTVVLAFFAFTLAHPTYAGTEEDLNAYFGSGTSYCDARTLAAYWKVDLTEAKARIGAEFSRGSARKVELQLQQARKKLKGKKRVVCEFWETNYSYEDAEALAGAWGVDVEQAKARVGREVSLGRSGALDDKLRGLGRTPGQVDPQVSALDAFWSSGLGYCDAELVATLWGVDVYEVKKTLGNKLLNGWHDLLRSELDRARANAATTGQRCDFWSTPYTAEDAAVLAQFWGIELEQAKARVAAAYTSGGGKAVTPQLEAARGAR